MSETQNLESNWQQSTTRRFLRWIFSWRTIRRCLIVLGVLIGLLVLALGVENWRGSRAWSKCKAELEAQGEKLDLASFVPPPVPDEQNMACAPIFNWLMEYQQETNRLSDRSQAAQKRLTQIAPDRGMFNDPRYRKSGSGPSMGSLEKSTALDLKAWQEFYRGSKNYPHPAQPQSTAADVLMALAPFEADLQEIAEAARRPQCRFPLRYLEGNPMELLLPHLATMKGVSKTLSLRAAARLDAGQTQEALADIKLGLRLAETINTEPILISHLVRIAMLSITLQSVQSSLQHGGWNDAQLAELEKALARIDLLSDYQHAMRGERAWSLATLDYCQAHGWPNYDGMVEGDDSWRYLNLLPSGWVAQNKVTIARLHQRFVLSQVDGKGRRVDPAQQKAMDRTFEEMRTSPYNVLAKLLMPALAKCAQKAARCQTLADHARLACALERHRLAHGRWPDKLDALAPPFLDKIPHDLINGEPLHYRAEGGGYVLWSVGWNQRDDGGQVVMASSTATVPDPEQSDWVWRMPAKPANPGM